MATGMPTKVGSPHGIIFRVDVVPVRGRTIRPLAQHQQLEDEDEDEVVRWLEKAAA